MASFTRMMPQGARSKQWRARALPAAAAGDTSRVVADLTTHGYAAVEGVLTPDECAAFLSAEDFAQAAWHVRTHSAVVGVFGQLWRDPHLIVSTEAAADLCAVPHVAQSSARIAAGEVCVRGAVILADAAPAGDVGKEGNQWRFYAGSHTYMDTCLRRFGTDTHGLDAHALSADELAWLTGVKRVVVKREEAAAAGAGGAGAGAGGTRETKEVEEEDDAVEEVEQLRTVVHSLVPRAGTLLLWLAHTAMAAPASLVPCLPVCYAPRAWATPAELVRKRAQVAAGVTTTHWPLFHAVVTSPALKTDMPALAPAGWRFAGFDAPPTPDAWAALAASFATVTAPPGASTAPPGASTASVAAPPSSSPMSPPRRRKPRMTVASPARSGMALTARRQVRVGSAATRTLVTEALTTSDTVVTLLEPELASASGVACAAGDAGFVAHDVSALDVEARAALATRIDVGWIADMYVAVTETIQLGRSALGSRLLKVDKKTGAVHCRIPTAHPTSTAAQCAAQVRAVLVRDVWGLAAPRRLSVRGFANDSVVVEVVAWEVAAVEAAVAPLRRAFAPLGVEVCVHAVPLASALWESGCTPHAVLAVLAITDHVERAPKWRPGARNVRVTLGTVDGHGAAVEGFADGSSVLLACHPSMSYVYGDLERDVCALPLVKGWPELTVRVGRAGIDATRVPLESIV